MHISKLARMLISASTLAISMPAVARADEPAAAESSNDIIVTARRVEERLQDVPISVSVFKQEQIDNRNIVNSTDLATYTPSLTSNTRFGPEKASFAIRGFVQDLGTAPSVGVYFADVVVSAVSTNGTDLRL